MIERTHWSRVLCPGATKEPVGPTNSVRELSTSRGPDCTVLKIGLFMFVGFCAWLGTSLASLHSGGTRPGVARMTHVVYRDDPDQVKVTNLDLTVVSGGIVYSR